MGYIRAADNVPGNKASRIETRLQVQHLDGRGFSMNRMAYGIYFVCHMLKAMPRTPPQCRILEEKTPIQWL